MLLKINYLKNKNVNVQYIGTIFNYLTLEVRCIKRSIILGMNTFQIILKHLNSLTMGKNKIPDNRVPNPLSGDAVQFFKTFFEEAPQHMAGLYSIAAAETKSFKKVSNDDESYCKDVVQVMQDKNCKVATNVNWSNIDVAGVAMEQFDGLAVKFFELATKFSRNAMQSGSYRYQHSATFEDDVDSAIRSEVKGVIEVKEKLEANRKKRNDAAASTRLTNEAIKKAEEEAAKANKSA
jgi:hypothetical protein